MTVLVFITATVGSALAVISGDWAGLFYIWVLAGLFLFVFYALCDAGNAILNRIPRENYNLTQNRYDLSESDDPTRPNENIPAIIEIDRQRRVK